MGYARFLGFNLIHLPHELLGLLLILGRQRNRNQLSGLISSFWHIHILFDSFIFMHWSMKY